MLLVLVEFFGFGFFGGYFWGGDRDFGRRAVLVFWCYSRVGGEIVGVS